MRPRPPPAARPALAALVAAFVIASLGWIAWTASRPERRSDGRAGADGIARAGAAVDDGISRASEREAPDDGTDAGAPRASLGSAGVLVRVLDRRSGAPLEDFVASLATGEELVAESPSDARGEIRFAAPLRDAVVRLFPPYGWSAADPRRAVPFREDGLYADVVFLAGPVDHGLFRGRFVDADGGEPVAHYSARLRIGEHRAEVASDRDGRFVTDRELPAGDAVIRLYDWFGLADGEDVNRPVAERFLAHAPVDGDAPEHEIEVPVGPTYRIEAEFPGGVAPERWYADLRAGRASLQPTRQAPIRWQGGPWVRFRPRNTAFDLSTLPRLVVTSPDGLWFGSGEPRTYRAIAPDPVKIEFEARGRIVARVVGTEGEPVASAIVTCSSASISPTQVSDQQGTSGNGLVEFQYLPAGSYRLSAHRRDRARREVRVDVPHGERIDLELVLPAAPMGSVHGRVVADASFAASHVEVWLIGARPSVSGGRVIVELPREGGERVAPFAFEDIVPGDYELIVGRSSSGPRRHAVRVTAPARGIELRASNGPSMGMYRMLVRDARSGDTLQRALATVLDDGRPAESMLVVAGSQGHFVLAPGSFVRMESAGFVARDVLVPAAAQDVVEIEVELERGAWSVEIVALGPRFAPLADVELFVDGASAGRTDGEGRLAVSREAWPRSLDVRYLDWILESRGRSELLHSIEHGRRDVRLHLSPE